MPWHAKEFLNRQATVQLARVGHSEPMIQEAKREAWWWLKAREAAVRRRRGLLAGHAIVWPSAGRAELVPVETPLAGRGEVTVKIVASVVSPGTERAQYLRLKNASVKFPYRPGYSAAGIVVATGRGVPKLRKGDLVAVRGAPHASVVTVPRALVHSVPDGVTPADAALVQFGVICGQAVRRAQIAGGERVCIVGAGVIGLLAQRLATAGGAGEVVVAARSRRKEAAARAGGAISFLSLDEGDTTVADLGAAIVIEASGDPAALAIAVAAAGDGGRIVLLGSPRGGDSVVPIDAIREKRLRLVGAHVGTLEHERTLTGVDVARREADAFLAALAVGQIRTEGLVDWVVDPREADAFYRELAVARDLVGAKLDWTRLPETQRMRPARLVRLPNLSARGVDGPDRPLSPTMDRLAVDVRTPFRGARGRLRFGLLGCGDIGIQNAAAIATAPNAELAACYDPAAELADELARAHGASSQPSVEALLEHRDVDVVFVAAPHHLHAPLASQAAAAGKHLIVEKPPANDLAGAVALVRAAERAGVTLSFCFPHRYDPRVAAARELVASGALGELTGTLVNFWMDKTPSYWIGGFSGRALSSWRSSRAQAGGGVLIMNLSHYVDLLRHLTGTEVETVSAVTGAEDDSAEIEDSVSVAVRYANGGIGTLVGCSAQRGNWGGNNDFRLWGRDGHIAVEPKLAVYTLRSVNGLRTNRWQGIAPVVSSANVRAVYISQFATAIAEGAPPDVSPDDGLAAQAFIEAAYRSSELGCRVRPADLLRDAGA